MSTNTPENHYNYTHDEYSRNPLKQIVDFIQDHSIDIKTIVDIGANSGATAEIFGQFNFIESVYCFEPDSENFEHLSRLFHSNLKYKLFSFGIYYGKRECEVYLPLLPDQKTVYQTCGGYSIEPSEIHNTNTYKQCGKTFQLRTLEECIHKDEKIDFIKLDVEGSEKNILMHSPLVQKAKYLFIEIHHFKDFHLFRKMHLSNFKIIYDFGSDCLLERIGI